MLARAGIALLLGALALTGCASRPGGHGTGPEDPASLVGLWRVSDASGESGDTWLRLGDELGLYRSCGWIHGQWQASGAAFLGAITGWNDSCGSTLPTADWLTGATGWQRDGDGVDLLGDDGAVLARLRLDGAPPHDPDMIDDYRTQPTMSPWIEAMLASAPAIPSGLRVVTSDELVGRWTPSDADSRLGQQPYVEFTADGAFRGSDGANGIGGRWRISRGAFLGISGPTTLIGSVYDLSQAGSWLGAARAVALDGPVLVLLAADGTELGRLVPERAETGMQGAPQG